MANNVRTERPIQTIKPTIVPLANDVKVKVNAAIQAVVNKIKDKHL
jgi:hypothetical protein